MTKATPKLEPELNPKTYGPASGFLNKVCIINPEIDKPIPTKTAVNALGNRKFQRMISQEFLISFPKIESKIALIGIETEPKLTLSKNIQSKLMLKNRNIILFFDSLGKDFNFNIW